MKTLRLTTLCAASFALAAAAALAAEPPAKTADGFYAVYLTARTTDGIPDKAIRSKYERFLSPALNKLLADGEAAQARFSSANKNAPPLIAGDLFTSMFEGASAYKVGACKTEAKKASCAVNFTYDNKLDPPTRWSDTVYLVMTPGGWRIDDIGYGGDWEYANRGKLSETLRKAITDAGS